MEVFLFRVKGHTYVTCHVRRPYCANAEVGPVTWHTTWAVRHSRHFVKQNGRLPSSFLTKKRNVPAAGGGRRAFARRQVGAQARPPRASRPRGPPPGGSAPRPPPPSPSLTTCLQQATHMLCRALPGRGLRPDITSCTSEWLSFPRPSAASEPRRDSRASRGRVPKVSLHTAVKGQFGHGTGRALGKCLKNVLFQKKKTQEGEAAATAIRVWLTA